MSRTLAHGVYGDTMSLMGGVLNKESGGVTQRSAKVL